MKGDRMRRLLSYLNGIPRIKITGEAEVDWEEAFFRSNIESIQEEEEFDISYGVLKNPHLEKSIPNVEGDSHLFQDGEKILQEDYESARRYIRERVDLDQIDEAGMINPFGNGSYPTEIHFWESTPDETTIEDQHGLNYNTNCGLHVTVAFHENWDRNSTYSHYVDPSEANIEEF